MDQFLQMNIFFFVTTLTVIVVGALIAYVLWRIERILKNVEHISEQVAMETDIVRQDIAEMRSEIRAGKSRFKSLLGFVGKFTKQKSKKS